MFNGYRLKIDGVVFKDSYIKKGSYSCVRGKRVVETWVDANQVEHEVCAPTDKTIISFDIREHDSSEHANIVASLQKKDGITIQYYNDQTDAYLTGTFRRANITFSHKNLTQTKIDYNSANVVLTEN